MSAAWRPQGFVGLRGTIALALAVYAATIGLAHLCLGPRYFTTGIVVILILSIVAALLVSLYAIPAPCLPQVYVVCLYFGIFFFIRLAEFVIAPSGSIMFTLPPFNAAALESTLLYVFLGIIAFLLGLAAGTAPPEPKPMPAVSNWLRPAPANAFLVGIALTWIAGYIAAAIVTWYDATVFVTGESRGSAIGWLIRFLDPDATLIITIAWLVGSRGLTRPQSTIGLTMVIAWIAFAVLGGSRGAVLHVTLIAAFAFFATSSTPRIRPARFLGLVVVLAVLSIPIAFAGQISRYWQVLGQNPLAQIIRESTASGQAALAKQIRDDIAARTAYANRLRETLSNQAAHIERGLATGSALEELAVHIRALEETQAALVVAARRAGNHFKDERGGDIECRTSLCGLYYSLNPFLHRLGIIDYAVYAIAGHPDEHVINKYLRSSYAIMRIANGAVPGDIFSGVNISTAQVFGLAFRGLDESEAAKSYMAEPWTMWGYAKLVFGYTGGLAVIFLVGIILQLTFAAVELLPRELIHLARTFFLLMVTYHVVDLFGVDHFAMAIIHNGMALTGTYLLTMIIASYVRQPLPRVTADAELGQRRAAE